MVKILLIPLLLLSCATTPTTPPPQWIFDLQAVYPNEKYIAHQGEGKTRQEAEIAGLGAISLYFESQTSIERMGRESWAVQNGITVSESREVEQSTIVRSQTSLVAVRYAQDAWYNSAAKQWHTVAYIEQDEAWAVYEPQAKKISDTLIALYKSAESEGEPLVRVLRLSEAQLYSENPEYNAIRNFSQVLNPSKARVLFGESDAVRSMLQDKISIARQAVTVYIDCPIDFEGMIYKAAISALGAEGFSVERNRAAASCICGIQVEEGEQRAELGVFFHPTLSGIITGKKGVILSFSIKGARQGAVTPDVAKRRAYTALAATLQESFSEELNKKRSAFTPN
jgi:hypothetical protein